MRFYVEGLEIDVQDPEFFIDDKEYKELNQNLEEILKTYA